MQLTYFVDCFCYDLLFYFFMFWNRLYRDGIHYIWTKSRFQIFFWRFLSVVFYISLKEKPWKNIKYTFHFTEKPLFILKIQNFLKFLFSNFFNSKWNLNNGIVMTSWNVLHQLVSAVFWITLKALWIRTWVLARW